MLLEILAEMLASRGILFTRDAENIRFAVRCGSHRLEAAVTEDDESFLRLYIRYPWQAPEENALLLAALNALNAGLRAGCFLTDGGRVLFRCGVYIFDEFTARESAADLLITGFAAADSAWDEIFDAVVKSR